MENEFLTSGLACWNRQVKRAERASGPPVRLSAFTVDDQSRPRRLILSGAYIIVRSGLFPTRLARLTFKKRLRNGDLGRKLANAGAHEVPDHLLVWRR